MGHHHTLQSLSLPLALLLSPESQVDSLRPLRSPWHNCSVCTCTLSSTGSCWQPRESERLGLARTVDRSSPASSCTKHLWHWEWRHSLFIKAPRPASPACSLSYSLLQPPLQRCCQPLCWENSTCYRRVTGVVRASRPYLP